MTVIFHLRSFFVCLATIDRHIETVETLAAGKSSLYCRQYIRLIKPRYIVFVYRQWSMSSTKWWLIIRSFWLIKLLPIRCFFTYWCLWCLHELFLLCEIFLSLSPYLFSLLVIKQLVWSLFFHHLFPSFTPILLNLMLLFKFYLFMFGMVFVIVWHFFI